jgi:hypothetical protein
MHAIRSEVLFDGERFRFGGGALVLDGRHIVGVGRPTQSRLCHRPQRVTTITRAAIPHMVTASTNHSWSITLRLSTVIGSKLRSLGMSVRRGRLPTSL